MKYLLVLRNVALFVLLAVLFSVPNFIMAWSKHTTWVQEISASGVAEFKSNDIDWKIRDITTDREVLLDDVRNVIINDMHVFRVSAYYDERTAYINSLYDLIADLVNNPEDTVKLLKHQRKLFRLQQDFYDSIDKFHNNHYYAMMFTL